MYVKAKPPITPEGIRQCGGELVRWYDHRCIRLDGRAAIDSPTITAVVLLRVEGTPFPAVGKIGERKTHTAKGSVNSWITSGDVTTAETILDVEGVTDLLAVVSAGLPPGWVAVTNTAGAKARGNLPRPWAKGKRAIVAGDADEPGEEGKHRSAAAYHKAGAREVLYAQLPYAIEKDHGRDIRDWLNEGHTVADLPTVEANGRTRRRIEEKAEVTAEHTRREIIIGTDESRVIDEAIEALATRENVYQRGGCLVQVVEGTEPPAALLDQKTRRGLPQCDIRESGNSWPTPPHGIGWRGRRRAERIHPPDWVVKALDARGQWRGIRRLRPLWKFPFCGPTARSCKSRAMIHSPAYSFSPRPIFRGCQNGPSRADAECARDALLEIVEDFPFAAAHKAAWLAALLDTACPLRIPWTGAAFPD